jgi:NAD-dependent dihydropyrimidine dehydrogenase PreA subunit
MVTEMKLGALPHIEARFGRVTLDDEVVKVFRGFCINDCRVCLEKCLDNAVYDREDEVDSRETSRSNPVKLHLKKLESIHWVLND